METIWVGAARAQWGLCSCCGARAPGREVPPAPPQLCGVPRLGGPPGGACKGVQRRVKPCKGTRCRASRAKLCKTAHNAVRSRAWPCNVVQCHVKPCSALQRGVKCRAKPRRAVQSGAKPCKSCAKPQLPVQHQAPWGRAELSRAAPGGGGLRGGQPPSRSRLHCPWVPGGVRRVRGGCWCRGHTWCVCNVQRAHTLQGTAGVCTRLCVITCVCIALCVWSCTAARSRMVMHMCSIVHCVALHVGMLAHSCVPTQAPAGSQTCTLTSALPPECKALHTSMPLHLCTILTHMWPCTPMHTHGPVHGLACA